MLYLKISVRYLKISVRYLKISVRYLKISGLKISVHSLKIAGLKIIARMCVRMWVRMWVRGCVCGCAPHLANISKITQDATGATTTGATTTEHRTTSDHHKHQRTRIAKEIKKTIANKIFFYFLRSTFVFEIKIKAI